MKKSPDTTKKSPDNLPDTSPDTMKKSPDNLPDNSPDTIEMSADNYEDAPKTFQKNENSDEKIYISELEEKYGIKRDSLYTRMKYLEIKPWKSKNKAYLNAEQVAHMDGLHEHIKLHGRMEGYPVPEKSGPWESEITVYKPKGSEDSKQTSAMTKAQTSEMTQSDAPEQYVDQTLFFDENEVSTSEVDAFDLAAQELGATKYMASQDLADYYAATGNFTNPEIIEKIKKSRKESQDHWLEMHRNADPKALSQMLIARARAKASGRIK